MAAGQRPTGQIAGCFGCMFFGVFFASGAAIFPMVLIQVLRGDPDDNLQGKPPWEYLWVLFPLPFLAIGGGGLYHVWKNWGKEKESPERQKAAGRPAVGAAGGPVIQSRGPARVVAVMGDEYPTVPQVTAKPGQTLRHRLDMDDVPGCMAIGLGVLILICSGILTPLAWGTIPKLRDGLPAFGSETMIKAVFCGFLTLGLGLLIYNFFKQLFLAFLERPVVELSSHPLEPGERCQFFFSLGGHLRVKSLRVTVRCEEEASYRQGTDTPPRKPAVCSPRRSCTARTSRSTGRRSGPPAPGNPGRGHALVQGRSQQGHLEGRRRRRRRPLAGLQIQLPVYREPDPGEGWTVNDDTVTIRLDQENAAYVPGRHALGPVRVFRARHARRGRGGGVGRVAHRRQGRRGPGRPPFRAALGPGHGHVGVLPRPAVPYPTAEKPAQLRRRHRADRLGGARVRVLLPAVKSWWPRRPSG